MSETEPHRPRAAALLVIGAFKLFKATLLLLVGLGALKLLHHDVAEQLSDWISDFRIDPHSRYLYAIIQKLGMLDDHRLREIGFGSFFYATLLSIEGVGLCLRKRWAEFFTVGMTSSLVPLEIYELYERTTPTRATLLIVNLAIVWYLVVLLRRDWRAEREQARRRGGGRRHSGASRHSVNGTRRRAGQDEGSARSVFVPHGAVAAKRFAVFQPAPVKLVAADGRAVADHQQLAPARVSATFIRRVSARNPISPSRFDRTSEMTTASFSRP